MGIHGTMRSLITRRNAPNEHETQGVCWSASMTASNLIEAKCANTLI